MMFGDRHRALPSWTPVPVTSYETKTMIDLVICLLFFFLSVVVHLGFCRRHKKEELLISIFFVISGAGMAGYLGTTVLLRQILLSHAGSLWMVPLPLSCSFLYVLLIFLYLSFYVNVLLVSPSKKIMLLIREHKALKKEELLKHFTDEAFVQPRLDDLVTSGCCALKDGRYCLSASGRRVGGTLEVYQKLIGRPMGG